MKWLHNARKNQLDKKIAKAIHTQNGDHIPYDRHNPVHYIHLTATGTRERDMLLARGWELISQDMSERAQWVHCYMMRKRV